MVRGRPLIDPERWLRRAAPASDVTGVSFLNRGPAEEAGSLEKRLRSWRHNAAENSSDAFAERLAWENLRPEEASPLLGDERPLTPGDECWGRTARKIVRRINAACSTEEVDPDPAPADIPFAPVLAPLVGFALHELCRMAAGPPLTWEIESQLAAPLYRRLSDIAHRAVGGTFRSFRDALPVRDGAWRAFEEYMRRGGLLELFARLPVLLRLVAIAISLWVEETAEFLRRVEADREALGLILGAGRPPGAIRQISSMLSDPHRGGRNVKIITFASGLRAVYKPRSLATDVAWFRLTKWFGRRSGVTLRSPVVLNRGDWGWAEFIPHEPCENTEGVERFYRRAGHLLCLLYATSSCDFHHENIVACGEFPVPIDLETVFSPELLELDKPSVASLQFFGSVLQTLMLPNWMEWNNRVDAVDISALGSRAETQPDVGGCRWIRPNSDTMEFVAVMDKRQPQPNGPFLTDGKCPDAGRFARTVASGFAEAYDCLLENRDALLSSNGPLEAFRSCMTRVVVRPTRVYANIAGRALSASRLSCGIDRSLEFEGLARHFLAARESHGGRLMFRAEVRAMERLDIPYFQIRTDSRQVLDGEGGAVEQNIIRTPGFEKARQRIAGLCAADRAFQLELIEASFIARDFGGPDQPPAYTTVRGVQPSITFPEAARRIAHDIERRTIWDGVRANWIAYDTVSMTGRLEVRPLGPSLYSGLAGVGVFLSAVFAVDGGPQYRRAALGIARTLRRAFVDSAVDRKTRRTFSLAGGIGGATGAGSVIYGLVKAGQILNNDETIDTALCLCRLLDGDAIRADKRLDVIGGAAGAILSLLPLWKQTGEPEVLKNAVLCGERLLEMQTAEGAWLTCARRPLAGFSHGAAGIGLALLRLHASAPNSALQQAALAGFDYERSLLSPDVCNWEDLRDNVQDRFGTASWCHGAPGVALSRVGALRLITEEEVKSPLCRDLASGLGYLRRGEIADSGIVCCGEMGRAETLLEASRYLGHPALEVLARQRAACVAEGLSTAGERPFIPGFFQGSAGIGYGLLRLMAPDRLPSILLWD